MFLTKKIKEAEARIGALEERVHELAHKVHERTKNLEELAMLICPPNQGGVIADIDYLKVKMKDLIMYDNMLSLDPECHEFYLENKTEEEKEFYLACKEKYEARLKKFIRNSQLKKKVKVKVMSDGKETPKATE